MLAVVFGFTKFHDYIYSFPNVTVESDHKPLEAILKKPLCQVPLRLQKNDNDCSEIFNKCGQLVLTDTLSRAFLQDDETLEENFDVNIISIVPMSDQKLAQLKEATVNDPQLQQLSSIIKVSWPSNKQEIPKECLPFWNYVMSCQCMIMLRSRVRELSFQRRCNQKCCNTSTVHI